MRLSKIYRNVSVVALALAVGACDEGLTDLNENPNAPTDVAPEFILRDAIQNAVGTANGTGMSINHAGLWVQHVAQIQYADEDRYQPRADAIQGFWDVLYAVPLKDFETIIAKGKASGNQRQEAVALVMKSWTYGIMTDLWGDIPYSEALKGEAESFTPKYDTQQEIYNALFADLRRAEQMLAPGATGFGAADLIYGGDATKWRRFANALRMRLAIHLTKVDPAKARSEFEAAVATGVFMTSVADDAKLQYLAAAPNQNPYYTLTFVTGRDDHRVSTTMINTLKNLNDPRLPVYAQPIQADGRSFVGYGNGLPNNAAKLADVSRIGSAFLAANAPLYLMSFAEQQLIRAEAAARGWNAGGTAASLYESGVTAALTMYGVGSGAAAYLAQPSVAYNPATWQQQIATQKWLALYLQGAEAWTEWRRTGFPPITPGPQARAGGVPRRLPYPNLEISLNKANLDAAIARQGNTALQGGRVWWDKP